VQDGGGIELLDWIDITIFSEGEERLLVHFDPNWPDTGTYAVHTCSRENCMNSYRLIYATISCKRDTSTAIKTNYLQQK
jgi:hypothetical protein